MKKLKKPLLILLCLFLGQIHLKAQCTVFEEVNGVVAFEAEAFESQEASEIRKWHLNDGNTNTPNPDPDDSHASNASGGEYLEVLPDTRVTHNDQLIHGTNFSNTPGEIAVLNYKVYFNNPGKYFVWVRLYSTGSEDNGIHVGINETWPNSGKRMQWCEGKNNWTWASKQRTNANHCGVERQIFINVPSAGEHTIKFSMREDGTEIDKIVLSKQYDKPQGVGPAVVLIEDCDTQPNPSNIAITGELQRWHKVTLTCEGPNTNEKANPNPFTNYRFDATFEHEDGTRYKVPGYYAACDNPTEGCDSGDKWKVHFTPDRTGKWSYSLSFKEGNNVALGTGGSSAGFFDNSQGEFTINESNKSGRDFRAKNRGKLRYVGEHYLRFAGTGGDNANGHYFVKAGADAPENTLAYADFDATPNRKNLRKNWQPHQQDYEASDASNYTWKNGKGSELLGVINYFVKKNLNAFSFLTFSTGGDDQNVFPHLLKVSVSNYNQMGDNNQWNNGLHHTRFDVSKMAQWERIFEYADKKGVFCHFKTMERENCLFMDGGNQLGNERKIYYRELVARFGHHLALNWNFSEETRIPTGVLKDIADYVISIDPYQNHRVLHTTGQGGQDNSYDPLLGLNTLSGVSLQTKEADYSELKGDVQRWVRKSRNSGKKWVVALDEPGLGTIGIRVDDNGSDDRLVRNRVLWSTFLGGGMGVEYYYGSQTGVTDLNAQSHRPRDQKYTEASYALTFFQEYLLDKMINMKAMDDITSDGRDHVFADSDNDIYIIYRPSGGSTNIDLPGSGWKVQWYNPRSGGDLGQPQNLGNSLVAPNNQDWVAAITKSFLEPVEDDVLSTEDFITTADITVYPIPANNKLVIDGEFKTPETLEIYNLFGQKTMNVHIQQNITDIDVSKLAKGVYFITFKDQTGTIKFIKN